MTAGLPKRNRELKLYASVCSFFDGDGKREGKQTATIEASDLAFERDSDMGIVDKLWKLLLIEEECDNIPVLPRNEARSGLNMAGINDDKGQKVIVCKTEKFEEAQALVDQLKNNKQVVLNFENNTLPGIPQKILDFVSGAVYALDGQCQQLGQNIFVFTLASVEIIKDNRSSFGENEFGPFGTHRS